MLQWTGGSRRKMNNTRKSTYNRQRQYFEHKKRQKQTCGPNNCEDGKDMQMHCSEGPRSLDILSLTNLTTAPKCCSKDCTGDNTLVINSDPSKFLCSHPQDKTFPIHGIQLADRKGPSNHDHEAHAQKKQATEYHSHKVCDRLEEWKAQVPPSKSSPSKCMPDTEQQTRASLNHVSLLELLNDDRCYHNSAGSLSCEDHVAFSVEGLGKVGTETPVHSPKQTLRVTFGDLHTHPEIPRWTDMLEKFKLVEEEFDTRKRPSEISAKLGIMKKHLNKLTSSNFGKDMAPSDHQFCWKKRTQDRFLDLDENFLREGSCDETCKEQSFYLESDDFTFIEDKNPEMDFVDFGDIYQQDRRNMVEALEVSEILERHDSSFDHPRSFKDQDFTPFDWERHPIANQSLHTENKSYPFSWSFQETKDAINSFTFRRDEPNFLTAASEEGQTSSSCFKSTKSVRKSFSLEEEFWRKSEERNTENVFVDKVNFEDLDSIRKSSEVKWKSCPGQKKSWQGNYWEKTNCWSLFEGVDTDLVTSPFTKSSQTYDAFFDSNILSKDDPLDAFHDSSGHPCRDFSFRESKVDTHVNFDPSDVIYLEDHCKKQKPGPINLMKGRTIYPFQVKEGSAFLSSSEECNSPKCPGISIQKNVGKDIVAEESGLLSTACQENFQEAHNKFSIGESASSSKTLIASDAANNCTKHEELGKETPEGSEQSQSQKLESQSIDTPIVTEAGSEKRNDTDDGVAPSVQTEPENLNVDEEIVESQVHGVGNEEDNAGHSSCKMMLESYVLQLLCVQKVLMNTSVYDKEKKI